MKKIIIIFCVLLTQIFGQENWEYIGRMPKPVAGASAISYGDKIYILGGYSDSTGSAVNWAQSYNPDTEEWIVIEKMLTPRTEFSAGIYNQSIYYCGGSEEPDKNNYLEKWNFNLSSEAEIAAIDSNFNRDGETAVFHKNFIYLLGGLSSYNLDVLFRYKIENSSYSGSIQNIPAFSEAPILQMGALLEDQFYFIGGIDFVIMDKIFRMDEEMTSFTEIKPEILRPRAAGTAISSEYNRIIYLIGGYSETNPALSSVDMITFLGSSHDVKEGPQMIFGRKNPSVVKHENYIFVFGGFDGSGEVISSIEKLFIDGPPTLLIIHLILKLLIWRQITPIPLILKLQ